jgi:transcriptional antiterminator RfaH
MLGEAYAESSWYVVRSKPHKESWAQLQLQLKRLEVFYPKLMLPDYAKRRQPIVPLFPGYLFVRLALPDRYHDVIWAPGVQGFVGSKNGPLPVDDAAVELLRRRAAADGVIQAQPKLRPGQRVEVVDGPFAGLVGIIQQPPDTKGRIKVLMQLLNRAVAVDIPLGAINAEWAPVQVG